MRKAVKCFELTIFGSGNLGVSSQSLWSSNCGRKLRYEAFFGIVTDDENMITAILGVLTHHSTCAQDVLGSFFDRVGRGPNEGSA